MIRDLFGVGRVMGLLLAFTGPHEVALSADRSIKIQRGPDNEATDAPLGLTASLDRADPVYVVDDRMKLVITTTRPAAIKLWEIYPDGTIGHIGKGCMITKANIPLHFPGTGQPVTIGEPLGVTELHVQAIDLARSGGFCRTSRGTRSLGDPANRLAWQSQMQEVIFRYKVVRR